MRLPAGEWHMARKQAKRRKPAKAKIFRKPAIPVAPVVTVLAGCAVLVATYHLSGRLLQRPIESTMVATVETRKSSQDDMVDVLLCSMNSDLMAKVQPVHQI